VLNNNGEQEYGAPLLTVSAEWFDAMREYVRYCANEMGLRDYVCNYDKEPPDGDHDTTVMGSIRVNPLRQHLTIYLPRSWYDEASGSQKERESARHTVVHELIHVHLKRIDGLCHNLQTNLGDVAWQTWWCGMHDEMEIVVDNLATVLEASLPLPKMPKKPLPRIASMPDHRPENV
jgi:hypothetical protein